MYVLPNTEPCREDFEWIRSEIVALGGEATVFVADALNPEGDEDIVSAGQRLRDMDYRRLKGEADKLRTSSGGKKAVSAPGREASSRVVRTLRQRFTELERIDFFRASARQGAADSLAILEGALTAAKQPLPPAGLPRLAAGDFRHRRWVTRPRPGVDRMASAWLIRRFIDPQATFNFRDRPEDGEVPFDMYVGDFSHRGSWCTFETLAERFDLREPSVVRIGQIVHDLDLKENRYDTPEAPAVGRLVSGLQELHSDDQVLLQRGIDMFAALANSFSSSEPHSRRLSRPRNPNLRTHVVTGKKRRQERS